MLEGQGPSRNFESNEEEPSASTRPTSKKESKTSSRAPKTLSTAAKRYPHINGLQNQAYRLLNYISDHLTTFCLTSRTSMSHKESLSLTRYLFSPPSRERLTPSYNFICILTSNSSYGHVGCVTFKTPWEMLDVLSLLNESLWEIVAPMILVISDTARRAVESRHFLWTRQRVWYVYWI